MDLSVIIVNWNAKDYLRKSIESILGNTRDLEFEVIVVDSASFDGSEEMIATLFPDVHFIQCAENVGFAKANNLGFQAATGKYVLFLNPDTEIVGAALMTMWHCLQSTPDAGALGCRLLNSDGSIQTSSIRSFPSLLNELLDTDVLRTRFPRSGLWGTAPLFDSSLGPGPIAVDAISGASMAMRREAFENAGMFTTQYFMYSEDVDLCYKMHRLGLRNYYLPSAVVVHHGGGNTAQAKTSTFSTVMMVESRWRFFLATKSKLYGVLYRAEVMIVSAIRVLIALLLRMGNARTDKAARWTNAFKKWWARLRWAVGLERWAARF